MWNTADVIDVKPMPSDCSPSQDYIQVGFNFDFYRLIFFEELDGAAVSVLRHAIAEVKQRDQKFIISSSSVLRKPH
jgi:hypothetical protein